MEPYNDAGSLSLACVSYDVLVHVCRLAINKVLIAKEQSIFPYNSVHKNFIQVLHFKHQQTTNISFQTITGFPVISETIAGVSVWGETAGAFV